MGLAEEIVKWLCDQKYEGMSITHPIMKYDEVSRIKLVGQIDELIVESYKRRLSDIEKMIAREKEQRPVYNVEHNVDLGKE